MNTRSDALTDPLQSMVPPPERMPDGSVRGFHVQEYIIPPEAIPDLEKLVIEDEAPVDNIFAEKQQRLLTEPLYSSWAGPGEGRSFLALANVGLFYQMNTPAVVPDVMLSLDVRLGADLSRRENRSYFIWERGKAPDLVIEFVSDRTGGEESHKLRQYERIGITYYVVFDPEQRLGHGPLRAFARGEVDYTPTDPAFFKGVGLGLTLWNGPYEGHPWTWLRWCDRDGRLIATAAEALEQKGQQVDEARRLADEARRLADEARQQATDAQRKTDVERQKRERLETLLRQHGVEPPA
jgi:Uma2 family endonuclease